MPGGMDCSFRGANVAGVPSPGSLSGTDGTSTIPSSAPTVTVPTELDGMRWCRYAVEPDPPGVPESSETTIPGAITLHTGHFIAGGTLDSRTAQLN